MLLRSFKAWITLFPSIPANVLGGVVLQAVAAKMLSATAKTEIGRFMITLDWIFKANSSQILILKNKKFKQFGPDHDKKGVDKLKELQ
jgi:hypothetical protein